MDSTNQALETLLEEIVLWAEDTFQHASTKTILTHLGREVQELQAHPSDGLEYADCMMLLAHAAHKEGVDLRAVLAEKLTINKARQWGAPDHEGVVEHV